MVESKNSESNITIAVSTTAYGKLCVVQEELKKILRKKQVSFTQVIEVMFSVTRLDDKLIQMQLEDWDAKL